MLDGLKRRAVEVWRVARGQSPARPAAEDREARRARRRAEGTREIERLQHEIAAEERRERERRQREAARQVVIDDINATGWHAPGIDAPWRSRRFGR